VEVPLLDWTYRARWSLLDAIALLPLPMWNHIPD
jgi:hypothetical protein